MKIRVKIAFVFVTVVAMVIGFAILSLFVVHGVADDAAVREAENVAAAIAQASPENPLANPARAQRLVDRMNRVTGRDLFVVDMSKRIVADATARDVGTVYAGDTDKAIDGTLSDGRGRTFVERQPSGPYVRQFVAALHRNPSDRASPIVGAVVLEYTQIYDAVHAEARNASYVIGAIGFAVVFATSLLGLRVAATIVPQLAALRRGAETLAGGDYAVRVDVPARDEIGALATAFNRMAHDLQAGNTALLQHQRELESRVDARTADLAAAEEAQRQVAEELRLVMEHVPVGMCYIDRNLRFRHHNRRYATLLGLVDSRIDGMSLPDVYPPALFALVRKHIDDVLVGRQVVFERSKVTGDAESGSVQCTLVPRVDGHGAVVGYYGMLQDISERKLSEDALRRSNDELTAINVKLREAQRQLLQAGKMASIGQLASGVAHEINNPIGYVQSNLGTLQQSSAPSSVPTLFEEG